MTGIAAVYNGRTYWDTEELGFDLETAESWYIKWDVLYVKFSNTENYKAYEPTLKGEFDIKEPVSVEINGEEEY